LQITENAANTPAVGCTTRIWPSLEPTLTPPATGTLALLINSSPDAEFDGVGVGDAVAAAARVAIRKPFVTLIGTVRIDFVLGPLIRFPVLALNALLSFGQVTLADLTCEASKFVAS
jgi:hypothetical protein